MSSFPKVARRAFASIAVVACAIVSLPSGAAVTLLGNIALQPKLPARLTTCNVSVDGGGFVPNIAFASQPDPVARYTVTLAFFDRTNVAVGRVDVTDHGADVYDLPAHADSMTCAITRLTLDDGTVYPAGGGSGASLGGVAIGVLGAGAILGIALGASHHSSSSNPAPTITPSPTPTPSATSSGATATPTATGATATPTPTSIATSSTSYPPTPSPFPTSSTTAVPTLRPQHKLR